MPVVAPLPFGRVVDQLRSDWIQADVARHRQQLPVIFYQDGVVTALNYMAGCPMTLIEVLAVPCIQLVHGLRKIGERRLE